MIGKKILIIFEDGVNHVSNKKGICTASSELDVTIDGTHIIPRQRIIRMEIVD